MQIDHHMLQTREERIAFNEEAHYLGKPCKRNHTNSEGFTWRYRNGRGCVLCKREIALQWKRDNPQRHAGSTSRRDAKRDRSGRRSYSPFAEHASSIRGRARAKGIVHSIGADHLKERWREQKGRCFWTGVELDFEVGGARHMFRPSVDRIDPSVGYVEGNIVWSSNFANRARGDTPAKEFAEAMRRFGFQGDFRASL